MVLNLDVYVRTVIFLFWNQNTRSKIPMFGSVIFTHFNCLLMFKHIY